MGRLIFSKVINLLLQYRKQSKSFLYRRKTMAKVDWSSSNSGSGTDGQKTKIPYLKMVIGSVHKIRPVGDAIECFKYFNRRPDGQWRSVVCSDSENCPIGKKYGLKPQRRWMINVVDRSTTPPTIKVFEFPATVFNEFKKVYNITKKDIGGLEGGDFEIKVASSGKGKKFEVNWVGATPYKPEIMEKIKEKLYNLEEICKPVSPEDMEKILFGNGTVSTAQVAQVAQANNAVSVDTSSSNDEIPF
jgi:hypothetical protein